MKKVEKWNSVKVTFNLPQHAASRLGDLARRSPSALEALGINSVQVDGDQVISVILADQSSINLAQTRNLPIVGQSSVNGSTPPDSGIESSASTSGGSAENNGTAEPRGVPPATIEAVKRSVIDYLQSQQTEINEFRVPQNMGGTGPRVPMGPGPPSPGPLVRGFSHLQHAGGLVEPDNPVAGMEHMVNSRNIVSNSPLLVNLLRSASPIGVPADNSEVTIEQQEFISQQMVSTELSEFPVYPVVPQVVSTGHVVSQEPSELQAAVTTPKKKKKQYKKKNQNNLETAQSGSMQPNAHTVTRPRQMVYQYPGQEWYPRGPSSVGYVHQQPAVPYNCNFHGQYRHPQQQTFDMQQEMGTGHPPPFWSHPSARATSSHPMDTLGLSSPQYNAPEHHHQGGPNSHLHSELSPGTGPGFVPQMAMNHVMEGEIPGSSRQEHISETIDSVLSQVVAESGTARGKLTCDNKIRLSVENGPVFEDDPNNESMMEFHRKWINSGVRKFNGPDCDKG